MLQGIIQGESIPKISKRIMNVQQMNKEAAVRSARTIVTGAECKGRMDGYKRAQDDGIIMVKKWVSAHDNRTRDWHRDLDGAEKPIDEPFENEFGEIMYPGDPAAHGANVYNCRCTIAAVVKGFQKFSEVAQDSVQNAQKSTQTSGKNAEKSFYKKENSGIIKEKAEKQTLIIQPKQIGKKVGKHASDFGLDPSKSEDREKMIQIINDIHDIPDEIVTGEFRGQDGEVLFFIKKDDVVVTDKSHKFVTIMKGGINNARVKKARG